MLPRKVAISSPLAYHLFSISAAQDDMKKAASEDSALLVSAQQRAQKLLEGYVTNIGKAVGKEYLIKWNYIDVDGHASTKRD